MEQQFYKIDLDVDQNVIYMIYDIMRIVTIQVITHVMVCLNNSSIYFLNTIFIQTTIFLCISVMTYWLIIHKLFTFENKKDNLN